MHQAISSLTLSQVATHMEVQISTSKIICMVCSQTLKCLGLPFPKMKKKIPLFPREWQYSMISCCYFRQKQLEGWLKFVFLVTHLAWLT